MFGGRVMARRYVGENVRFKIGVWEKGKFSKDLNTGNSILDEYLKALDKNSLKDTSLFCGWKPCRIAENYRMLTVNRLENDNYIIYFLNTSPIDAPIYIDATFFSEKKEALEQLCENWGFDKSRIQENSSVQQWIERASHGTRDFDV